MLKFYITQDDLLPFEPSLIDYFREDQGDSFDEKIKAADRVIKSDLKNQGKKLKTLCTPLVLSDTGKEDVIERTRLVVTASSVTPPATVVLKGSDDDADYKTVTTVNVTEAGEITEVIDNTFNYYKVESTGTIEYTAELVEQSYEVPFIYLLLSQMFRDKINFPDDIWQKKADEYYTLYTEKMPETLASVDEDGDGEVDDFEQSRPRLTR